MNARLIGLAGLVVASTACMSLPFSGGRPTGRVRGIYTHGFEIRSFAPCDSDEVWWMKAANSAVADSLARGLDATDPRRLGKPGSQTVLIEVEGDTSSTGTFGHLGGYQREFRLKRVVSMAPLPRLHCRAG